ncbi:class III lanthionine synthetase LanKC [Luteimonas sp. MC1750]|uniref:class III lanthionine synthetase LanKC n=1 Tax=Luteimonas sp. MC1750 TaxID=2799326 RepID=UPI0018F09FFB|nr:class III lanthionine synthetase LanKC [Luteimonas sp. MC1750]MBJ6984498.1 class III lanthionine synthetase LanKC [Luteimonas sp. MC1750]QQO04890.1 class III lanthionine synthetase LanKC [Luteimonas sp. MC1750]
MRDLNAHPDFFIPYSARKPSGEYFGRVQSILPRDWRLKQDYFWTQAIRPVPTTVVQGWKIHVSATSATALATLSTVVPLCIEHDTEFKFASDAKILRHLLGKSCRRSQSGKFITIYPPDDAVFRTLLDVLHEATRGSDGPYVLSDRQYRDSSVIYYRYGGFIDLSLRSSTGAGACILDDRFRLIEDVRSASFSVPDFVDESAVIGEALADTAGSSRNAPPDLFGRRFEIESAIKFSNFGGVYAGRSVPDGAPVVIKEARPLVCGPSGQSAADSLRKEYRLLTLLSGTGIAPEPISLFQEWRHLFLAQERIPGYTLREHQARSSKLVHAGTDASAMREWIANLAVIARNLLQVVERLHAHGIVFGDLSMNNVIVDADTLGVRLIDFEGAYEPGVDAPVNLYTPGYAPQDRFDREGADYPDDLHALGSILVALMMPNTAIMALKPAYARELLEELRRDIGLPASYVESALGLLSGETSLREAIRMLEGMCLDPVRGFEQPRHVDGAELSGFCAVATSGFASFCLAHMDLGRSERVFPVGPGLEDPLCVDQGMAGIGYAFSRITGTPPVGLEDWLSKGTLLRTGKERVGLLDGAAGTAWMLAEFGRDKDARRELGSAGFHRSLFEDMSLGHGAAGYGYANLKFWLRYQEPRWLDEAERVAEVLCARAVETGTGLCWTSPDGDDGAPVGLHEGGAGVALFLLYLHCVTGKDTYLDAGTAALASDIACGRMADGSLGFPRTSTGSILYPYLAFGSAGIGSVALRYHAVTGRAEYADLVARTLLAASSRYTVGAGLYLGLAGLGNYLLDVAQFLGDRSALARAQRCASGLQVFAVCRDEGIAFPDANGLKLNCDYASGSAGIAMFLHRLAHGGMNFDLMLDEALGAAAPGPLSPLAQADAMGTPPAHRSAIA